MKKRFHGLRAWLVLVVVLAAAGTACLAQAPATQPVSAPAATEQRKVPVFELATKGGWYMIPIAFCSVMGVTIIFERFFALRRGKIVPPNFLPGLKEVFRAGVNPVEVGIAYCRARDCPIGRVLSAGLHKLDTTDAAVEEAVEDVGANEVSKLRRNLRLLFGVAAVSPMMGLLGSVSGMIRSFQVASIIGVGKAELLSKGIYEALVCTYGGLLVAIPTLIFYYFFLNRIDGILNEMNDVCRQFLEHYRAPKKAP